MVDAGLGILALIIYFSGCVFSFKTSRDMRNDLYPDKPWNFIDYLACGIAFLTSWGGYAANNLYWPYLSWIKEQQNQNKN